MILWFYCALVVINSVSFFNEVDDYHKDDEWLDPFDIINYDLLTKNMRKPPEASNYRSSNSPEAQCPDMKECTEKVNMLQREIEEHRRRVILSPQQPTCNPVFKRFLARLLKEIEKLELPTAQTAEMHYDAEVKLTGQMVSELQKILKDDGSWTTGPVDDALSQILINFKLHNQEPCKGNFKDTFGVELDPLIKVSLVVLAIVAISCSRIWSVLSSFLQFKRMFALCFFISIVWNWLYLYQIAFAEHQASLIKVWALEEKCTGLKKIDWMDNLKEWFRTTLTLQDDPCKQYYEALFVNPILLVPPTKAITITITGFITDPMKLLGQGISDFFRALLKDLPVTLQIPVLLLIGLCILAFIYSSAQAAVHHALCWSLRGNRQDPPPSIAQQPAVPPLQEPERHGDLNRNLISAVVAELVALPRHYLVQKSKSHLRRCSGQASAAVHKRRTFVRYRKFSRKLSRSRSKKKGSAVRRFNKQMEVNETAAFSVKKESQSQC